MPPPVPRRARRPLRVAVRGAVQPSTAQPSMGILSRQGLGPSRGPVEHADRNYLLGYQGWQAPARRAARTKGVARFAANMVAATAARVLLRIEEQNPDGDWDETSDAGLGRLMSLYRNDTLGQGPAELVRLHTWHYQVSGEGCLLNRDSEQGSGAEWMVISMPAIEFGRPTPDVATVSLVPGGRLLDGTAFVIPRDQVVHFWMPDEDWLAYAVSPMTAAMDDLARYDALARHARRQADNYLAMNGAMWTPAEAHESDQDPDDPAVDSDTPKKSPLLEAYERMAKTSLNDFDDSTLEAVIPPMWWWDGEKPEWIEVGRPLDEHGIAYRSEALGDYARDLDVPASLVTGGGSDTESNHWQAYMTKDRFVATVAPTLDRVTHQDLTVSFLWPLLRLSGISQLSRYRVGYDPTPVIKEPAIKIDEPIRAWLAGILGREAALQRCGYDPAELATGEDLEILAAVLSNFASGVPGSATPVSVTTPPSSDGRPVEGPPGTRPDNPVPAASVIAEYMPLPYPALRSVGGNGNAGTVTVTASSSAAMLGEALNPSGTGIMVSLDVPADVASSIAVPDGEPADALHVTLAHLPGGVEQTNADVQPVLAEAATQAAAAFPPPTVDLTHVERFVAGDEGLEPVVLVDDGPEVYAIREKLAGLLDEAGVGYSDDHGFRCHVTLGYWPPGEGPEAGPLAEPVSFTPAGIAVHWGADVVSYPFASSAETPEPMSPTGSTSLTAAARDGELPKELRDLFTASRKSTKATLSKIARIRRDAGREIAAAAVLALAEALRHVGVRAVNKAKNRSGSGLADAVVAAVEQGTSLRPFFGRLGVDEEKLLAGEFDGFETRARQILARASGEIDSTADRDSDDSDRRAELAAAFLAGVLLALARRRILEGTSPTTNEAVGEISGDVPARYIADAVGIAEGRLAPVMPDHPDVFPTTTPTGLEPAERAATSNARASLIERLTAERAAETDARRVAVLDRAIEQAETTQQTTYEWVWGFWSTPLHEFEPHFRLNGTPTTDPESDPAFANDEGWPDGDFYQPQDHDGCSCELVAVDVGSGG